MRTKGLAGLLSPGRDHHCVPGHAARDETSREAVDPRFPVPAGRDGHERGTPEGPAEPHHLERRRRWERRRARVADSKTDRLSSTLTSTGSPLFRPTFAPWNGSARPPVLESAPKLASTRVFDQNRGCRSY